MKRSVVRRIHEPDFIRMNLLDLPNEILFIIAAYLDVESQIVLARVNHRLRNVSTRTLRIRRFTEPVMDHLREDGHLIRTLDISNCKRLPTALPEIIMGYPNIKVLNMVNTQLSFVNLRDLLKALTQLESLSFSLTMLTRSGPMEVGSSTSVKKLYVEARPDIITLSWIIRLMNRLEGLRSAHVNLVGAPMYRIEPYCPTLKASRWETLRTLVCSCYLSKPNYEDVQSFLRSIFHSNSSPGIDRWCAERKDCYVYENGHVNIEHLGQLDWNGGSELLSRIRSVDLERDSELLRFPWGHPRSLRIRHDRPFSADSDFGILGGLLTSTLVELDLTDCHGIFSDEFWRRLAESSPGLGSLALPLCFFVSPVETSGGSTLQKLMQSVVRPCGMARHGARFENSWLHGIKLRKLYLKAPSRSVDEPRRDPIVDCERCAQPLNFRSLPRLEYLAHLDELTFNNVSFDPPALRNMANSKAHTIRLNLRHLSTFRGMRDFLARCTNLQNLKLSGLRSRLNSRALWEALSGATNLKQLCLGTCLGSTRVTFEKLDPHDIIPQIPRNVESFHFHVSRYDVTDSFKVSLFEYWGERGRCESLSEMIHSSHRYSPVGDEIRTSRLWKPFLGRSLCHAESFAGYVKPIQWSVGEL